MSSATGSKSLSPKQFGEHLSQMVQAIEPPKTNASEVLQSYWERLCEFDFDASNGELAWLKGTFLNRLFPIDPKKKGIYNKKQWADWRKVNLPEQSDETLRNWRKVADKFTRIQARKTGLSKMYQMIRAEAEAARINSDKTTPKPPTRKATDKPAKPVPIAEFASCWTVVHEQLEGMGKVTNAPDRFDDPKGKLGILDVQEANIKTARGMLDELEEAIAKTRKDLEAYIEEQERTPLAKKPTPVKSKLTNQPTSLVKKPKQWVDLSKPSPVSGK